MHKLLISAYFNVYISNEVVPQIITNIHLLNGAIAVLALNEHILKTETHYNNNFYTFSLHKHTHPSHINVLKMHGLSLTMPCILCCVPRKIGRSVSVPPLGLPLADLQDSGSDYWDSGTYFEEESSGKKRCKKLFECTKQIMLVATIKNIH